MLLLTGGQVGFVSSRTVPLNSWSHVAMTYDGAMLRSCLDGVDAGSRPATGTLLPPAPEMGVVGGTAEFAGTIDELRFYRRALSQAEIRLDSATLDRHDLASRSQRADARAERRSASSRRR